MGSRVPRVVVEGDGDLEGSAHVSWSEATEEQQPGATTTRQQRHYGDGDDWACANHGGNGAGEDESLAVGTTLLPQLGPGAPESVSGYGYLAVDLHAGQEQGQGQGGTRAGQEQGQQVHAGGRFSGMDVEGEEVGGEVAVASTSHLDPTASSVGDYPGGVPLEARAGRSPSEPEPASSLPSWAYMSGYAGPVDEAMQGVEGGGTGEQGEPLPPSLAAVYDLDAPEVGGGLEEASPGQGQLLQAEAEGLQCWDEQQQQQVEAAGLQHWEQQQQQEGGWEEQAPSSMAPHAGTYAPGSGPEGWMVGVAQGQ